MRFGLVRSLSAVVLLVFAVVVAIGVMASSSEPAAAQQLELPGDANCDGDITIIDAVAVAQYTVELRQGAPSCPIEAATEISLANADLNDDGDVGLVDAVLIARCTVGINTELCGPQTPTIANDQMVDAIEIFPNEAGYSVFPDPWLPATFEPDENEGNCVNPHGSEGSVWYQFTATTGRVSIVPENDDQYAGIFRAADGVTNPTQMSDLSLISCGQVNRDVGAIVRPGETYWVAVSGYWGQELWFFEGTPGCPDALTCENTKWSSNDRIQNAMGIDLPSADFVDVPAYFLTDYAMLSYTPDEIENLDCARGGLAGYQIDNPRSGSVWYQVVAPGEALEIRGGDDQNVGIYAPNEPRSPATIGSINGLDDLTLLACDEPEWRPRAATVPGQTYYVVAWGDGTAFSIGAPPRPPNDELIDAIPVIPSASGTFVQNGDDFRATFADDENNDNCHNTDTITNRGQGSIWYRFEATTSRVSVIGGAVTGIHAAVDEGTTPTAMADLELVSCSRGGVSAIVRPGATYWLSIGHAESSFWLFENDPLCAAIETTSLHCRQDSNDSIAYAAGIDVSGASPMLIDDFTPGPNLPGETNIELTYGSRELGPEFVEHWGPNCIDVDGGTVWYRLDAPSTALTISGNDEQTIGVYRSLSQSSPTMNGAQSMAGVEEVGCGTSQDVFTTDTVPGETYYLVVSGTHPEQIFSIDW